MLISLPEFCHSGITPAAVVSSVMADVLPLLLEQATTICVYILVQAITHLFHTILQMVTRYHKFNEWQLYA
jgi:hypothetical protein